MNVGMICGRSPISVEASTPLSEVARLMCDHHIGAVIVTQSPLDSPVVVGIITDRDITRAQLERASDLSRLSTAEVMTRDPLVLCEDVSIEDAIERMQSRGVRRAPVISPSGTLIGIVSTDDLIAEIARELTSLARLLELQSMLEGLRGGPPSAARRTNGDETRRERR